MSCMHDRRCLTACSSRQQAEKHCLQRQLEDAREQADGSQAELAAAHAAAADFESKFLAERQQRRQVRYRRSMSVCLVMKQLRPRPLASS